MWPTPAIEKRHNKIDQHNRLKSTPPTVDPNNEPLAGSAIQFGGMLTISTCRACICSCRTVYYVTNNFTNPSAVWVGVINGKFPVVALGVDVSARIKKIMQADEDVGKIALAVPVLVSKALELFLQDLCDRTYEITLQRGAKTMNSLHLCSYDHQWFSLFSGFRTMVTDHSDAAGEDRAYTKRRKAAGDECNDSDEELKRSKMYGTKPSTILGAPVDNATDVKDPLKENTRTSETKHEEYPGWSLPEMDHMAIDPIQLAS
uniref:Transcription factor CBF/NF-Y/archaeal histone domain-containing protein n=1 Tax=Cannabis sativa TaxID=3483 RepID=A0A803P2E4_CANSA